MPTILQWKYNEDQAVEREILSLGYHPVTIDCVSEEVSKTGRDMVKITLVVEDAPQKLFHYIVFMEDRPEITQSNLKKLFECFEIPSGCMDIDQWFGRQGAVEVSHEEYNGKLQARIKTLVKREAEQEVVIPF